MSKIMDLHDLATPDQLKNISEIALDILGSKNIEPEIWELILKVQIDS